MRVYLFLFPVLAALAGPAAVALGGPPRPDRPVLVLFPPWANAGTLVAGAGGQVLGPLRAPFAVFAMADAPDFTERVRRAGAWWVMDGGAVASICGAG